MDEDFESIKGASKLEALCPKIPIINEATGKRQDGRSPTDIRPIFLQTGVRKEARGSSYIEMGSTKVICVVSGPKDLSKKVEFSTTGLISVDIQLVGGKVPERDVTLVKECLEGVVLLEKFPKCLLEVYLTVMEDGGSMMAACITATGIALIEAGIPICDTLVGSTLLLDGGNMYLDPSRDEIEAVDLTDQEKNERGGGLVTLGYLPSRDQVCLFCMEGRMEPATLEKAMDVLTEANLRVFSVIKDHSLNLIKTEMDSS